MTRAFDEMSGDGSGAIRDSYKTLAAWLENAPVDLLQARSRQAELFFRRMGVTFAVYGDEESNERLIPFDVVPRIIGADEWSGLEKGLKQRVAAINAFLKDIYGAQECIRAGIVPADLILTNPHYRPEMQGRRPPAMSGAISRAWIWCAPARTASMFSKTTAAPRPASPTCWRTAR